MSDSSSKPALLVIARSEQELGSWPESEVRRLLSKGQLLPTDYFWREGMPRWLPLSNLAPGPALAAVPESAVFPIHFGSAYGVDKFGFVGQGELVLTPLSVELRGRRHWSYATRLILGIIAWPILAWLFFAFSSAFPRDGGVLLHGLAIVCTLMAVIGAPMLAMMLTHYLCVSPGTQRLDRARLSSIERRGRQITFSAVAEGAPTKPRTSLFRAADEAMAAEIERSLRSN